MNTDTKGDNSKKVGLALSGGGVRGVAHLGVIQALTDHGIRFSHISGTSAGAVAAAFLRRACHPEKYCRLLKMPNCSSCFALHWVARVWFLS